MELNKSYMYVLKCSDETFYTGYTTDLIRRIKTHNSKKGAKYTRARVPVELEYFEEFFTKSEATKAESSFKKLTRLKKEEYIKENLETKKKKTIIEINNKIKKEK